jgi:hypothetical protein
MGASMARRARPRSLPPYLATLALVAAGGVTGCQFNPGDLTGNPDPPTDGMVPPDAPPPIDAPRPIDAPPLIDAPPPPDAGPPPDAAPLPPAGELVKRGLLTRYLINEATDGQVPTALGDSAPMPLPLTIDYAVEGAFIDDNGHYGLRWNTITATGKASAPLAADGKVWLGLDGSTTGTVELVVAVDSFIDGSRLSHIGERDDSGVFTLRIDDEPEEGFAFSWNNAGRVGWADDVDGLGRAVVHVVLDSGQPNPNERVRLYVNGASLPMTSGTPPARDEAIENSVGSNAVYALGNTNDGNRGVQATFFYASMYRAALDEDEVMHNSTILLANDDTPGQ